MDADVVEAASGVAALASNEGYNIKCQATKKNLCMLLVLQLL